MTRSLTIRSVEVTNDHRGWHWVATAKGQGSGMRHAESEDVAWTSALDWVRATASLSASREGPSDV